MQRFCCCWGEAAVVAASATPQLLHHCVCAIENVDAARLQLGEVNARWGIARAQVVKLKWRRHDGLAFKARNAHVRIPQLWPQLPMDGVEHLSGAHFHNTPSGL